ncbi:3-hydroxy-3-methylglutaryl-coenzyme A reductase isoform X1 [Tetranychus urticae]|uniref:3-hydroxy-3-methylglutaryl coenzyme A reductase n=2 Tax=Tetranychus urticae TaxID=32264 RepID=T1K4I8_TETUR|nr:3-hydroxy-3-methylglutaryl-coenzyme A reductase isoform X1 [Tetranychus urticae]
MAWFGHLIKALLLCTILYLPTNLGYTRDVSIIRISLLLFFGFIVILSMFATFFLAFKRSTSFKGHQPKQEILQKSSDNEDETSHHNLKALLQEIEVKITSDETQIDSETHQIFTQTPETCEAVEHERERALTPNNIVVQQDSDTESVIVENKKRRPSRLSADGKNSPSFFLGDDSLSDSCDDLISLSDSDPGVERNQRPLSEKKTKPRPLSELIALLKSDEGLKTMTEAEIILLVDSKIVPQYKLEILLDDPERGVKIRRAIVARDSKCTSILENLPFTNYDYKYVLGACCENVIGYMPIPLGVAGPLLLDDKKFHIPMATTEGCLIASTNRGCRALMLSGGVRSAIVGDGMTRAPCVKFPNAMRAAAAMRWIQQEDNFAIIKESFDSTSRFARLDRVLTRIAGPYVYFRFSATTGDAMGMNMISKGAELAIMKLKEYFPDMEMNVLSGNFCSDKKPSAVNWIEGRGKSVVCEAEIPGKIVRDVLKTNVQSLVQVNISKNLIGSAVSGTIGGFNAHAANIVAAMYIATGQDPAQSIGSSNCITLIESTINKKGEENLYISCTMPSLELGTIGGGTILPPQASCLDLLGVRGSCVEEPGRNSQDFARIVCGTVLAAELSLLSALAAGHLVKSHMKHNRSTISINASSLSPLSSHAVLRSTSQFLTQCQPQ